MGKQHRAVRVRSYLDAIAAAWLGYSVPPARQALESASWRADARSSYCGRCGDSLGDGEATSSGCASCRGRPSGLDGFVRLGRYGPPLRDWIVATKFERWSQMGLQLGDQLGRAVAEARVIDPARVVVVPMPMPWPRRLHRGIDHARVIALGVGRRLEAPVICVLAKSNGPPQITQSATDRRRLGGRGLRIRRRWGGWPLSDVHLLLVDDVRTTGGSLRAAARRLRSLGPARLVAAVLAVADAPARRADPAPERRETTPEITPDYQ